MLAGQVGTNDHTLYLTQAQLDHVPQIRTVNATPMMNQELITTVENRSMVNHLMVMLSLELLLSPELQDLPV